MRKSNALVIIAALLVLQGIVSASGGRPASSHTSSQETEPRGRGFIPVEGSDLKSKLAAAAQCARSRNVPFWTAFFVEMRSGVAVDMGAQDYEALANGTGGANALRAAPAQGQLAVFLLHTPDGSALTRIEVYDLGRQRDYEGRQVFWLGHIQSDESLSFFQSVAETHPTLRVAERAVVVIALHDDASVPSILKSYARASANARLRETAILWLGHLGGESPFLSDLVRDEQERTEVRKRAALALGIGMDRTALTTIQSLYESVAHPEVKKMLLFAASLNESAEGASDFLLKVAQGEGELQVRKQAVVWAGLRAGPRGLSALAEIFDDPNAETEMQKHAVLVLGQRPDAEAVALLIKVAKTHPKEVVRRRAIFWLAQRKDERAQEFLRENSSK